MFEKNLWLVRISKNLAFGTPYCTQSYVHIYRSISSLQIELGILAILSWKILPPWGKRKTITTNT